MKMDWFTKLALGIIVLTLFAISLRPLFHTETVGAATRQRWEYKSVIRERTFPGTENGGFVYYNAADWTSWAEDGHELPTPVDMVKKLSQLGQDGWELVTVEPSSDAATSGVQGGFSMAGATTDERWVFKRPKY